MAALLRSRGRTSLPLFATGQRAHFCSDAAAAAPAAAAADDPKQQQRKPVTFAPGIYKAILIGQVGQPATSRMLGNGTEVVNFALGTGGLRNNRRALEGETSEAYAERSFTQWHRICVFKPALIGIAKQLKKGSNVYVEGNIETRTYMDSVSGIPKRVREISVRQNGRLYMMGEKPLHESEVET